MTDSEKFDIILEKITALDQKVTALDQKVTVLDQKVTALDQRVSALESDMREVKDKITKIDMVLENEIRVNIQRVAEGHLDLSRNMHEVMKPNNEIEVLAIKVRMLESDVREIKRKIS